MRLGAFYRSRLLRHLGHHHVKGRILDIGGFDGLWAASLHGTERYVVDLDPVATYPGVHYLRGDGELLPFRGETFDAVFLLDVLEHVRDEQMVVAEAVRVVRPGGRLILTTPSRSIRIFPGFLQGWVNRRWGHDRRTGFEPREIETLMKDQNLTELRVRPVGVRAMRWTYLLLAAVWRLPGPLGRWTTDLASRWDARHLEGGDGEILVEAIR